MTAPQDTPAGVDVDAAPVGAVYRVGDELVVRTPRGWYLLHATRPTSAPPADALLVVESA